jgi:hypothetical protein
MRDEQYILGLCDRVLDRQSLRQHRFEFLVGDTGRRLPVDAFYPDLGLVIEYRERQHTEDAPFFNRRMTVSGIHRGEQRALYDRRRREVLPRHGIQLIELSFSDFAHSANGRLKRTQTEDVQALLQKLERFVAQPVDALDRLQRASPASTGR